ncbi:type II toxin-antitoxin system RelE/ParE family toxin [Marinomonas sp. BSi20584]|uniref:type II toxin-antitoxin system RelE/ParE family toxin n=1 Tax=Marinomonas sp. BSi20584 TaxID=1594462 RepID=UPI0022B77DEE|nr:type II toxin-antitoxin system RelE/ParE family toxin [Marinomonas sp. BSi20584]
MGANRLHCKILQRSKITEFGEGNRDGIWSITVNGNWRITFEFIDGNAYILNYEDYH